jgi:hypothetical protein
MCIGKDIIGRYHKKYMVLCGLEQMIKDDVMTKFEVLYRLEQMIKDEVIT